MKPRLPRSVRRRGLGGPGVPATWSLKHPRPRSSAVANSAGQSNVQERGETAWRPLLQVDRVVWPSIHNRLQTTAPAAIEQMTDGLLSLCASGSKVLGLASCASGEGVTTLLLAAARKLLSQGRKVVLVDANWSNPQLAQSLGLLPQIGWEETLCGGLPLEEVVIESLADGLAVLPVREPSASAIAQGKSPPASNSRPRIRRRPGRSRSAGPDATTKLRLSRATWPRGWMP